MVSTITINNPISDAIAKLQKQLVAKGYAAIRDGDTLKVNKTATLVVIAGQINFTREEGKTKVEIRLRGNFGILGFIITLAGFLAAILPGIVIALVIWNIANTRALKDETEIQMLLSEK